LWCEFKLERSMRSALWYQKSKMYHKYFEQHEHELVGMQLA